MDCFSLSRFRKQELNQSFLCAFASYLPSKVETDGVGIESKKKVFYCRRQQQEAGF
jgi:hypothetical protein